MSMHMELAPGDTLLVGGTRIRLERKTGQRARLVIDGPDGVSRIKAGQPVPPSTALERKTAAPQEPTRSEPRPFLTGRTPKPA